MAAGVLAPLRGRDAHRERAARSGRRAAAKAAEAEQPLGKEGGFELIRKDRYLMLIAALIVVLNVVNTTGEYLLSSKAQQEAGARFGTDEASRRDRQKFMSGFYGDFFGWVNLLGFLAQIFAVSRVIKVLGVGGALFVHPVIALVGYTSMIWAPSLALVRNLKIADNATDYSLNNTVKQALWLPTSREAKYKAKQAVDSFFWRAGDVLSAVVVFVGEKPGLRGARLCRRQRGLRPRLALHRVEAREREQAPHGGRHGGLGGTPRGLEVVSLRIASVRFCVLIRPSDVVPLGTPDESVLSSV